MRKKLPVGIENFAEFSSQDFYYVDKTMFIAELLHNWGKVNLFTRPRRFGKSLNMSMLKAFFEIGCDKTLFKGLNISREFELCEKYMGNFPVISVTLKNVEGLDYQSACAAMRYVIGTEASRFRFLLESDKLTEDDKCVYRSMIRISSDGEFTMSEMLIQTSLKTLSMLLSKHYGKKVILLIDEYDVPLDRAFQEGYYDKMLSLIRNLFGNVLKTNESLQFAVLTGCLRISKESIFTGLNNLKVHTITDVRYDEYFGFTDAEVEKILDYYGLLQHASTMREWYDGYQFGDVSVYCPWDVINYCDELLAHDNQNVRPKNYWANTSGNVMVRRFIGKADRKTKSEIERLVEGESIVKAINQELTYNELDKSIENLWSVLFTTGYLTQNGQTDSDDGVEQYRLKIPNKEIRSLFVNQIQLWFQAETRADTTKLEQFCEAFPNGDAAELERILKEYLWTSISIRDTAARSEMKENFFHGLLLGLLQYKNIWEIASNAEAGEGYSDISIKTPDGTGVVIELKYAENGDLDQACVDALEQIEEKKYDAEFVKDGVQKIVKYGIAFYKKNCKVVKMKE